MNKVKNIFIAFALFGLVGCATLPPPKPLDPQRALIGISLKTRAPLRIVAANADMVYFIEVDKEGGLYTQGSFVQSNYVKGRQAYLLNLRPGRYAAVACLSTKGDTSFFSKELIKLTEVTVTSGTIAFMGEYVVDESRGLKDADSAQSHYFQMIAPDAPSGVATGVIYSTLFGKTYSKGSLHEEKRDKQAEIKFLTNALEHFKGTGWTNIIQKRMKDLKPEK